MRQGLAKLPKQDWTWDPVSASQAVETKCMHGLYVLKGAEKGPRWEILSGEGKWNQLLGERGLRGLTLQAAIWIYTTREEGVGNKEPLGWVLRFEVHPRKGRGKSRVCPPIKCMFVLVWKCSATRRGKSAGTLMLTEHLLWGPGLRHPYEVILLLCLERHQANLQNKALRECQEYLLNQTKKGTTLMRTDLLVNHSLGNLLRIKPITTTK